MLQGTVEEKAKAAEIFIYRLVEHLRYWILLYLASIMQKYLLLLILLKTNILFGQLETSHWFISANHSTVKGSGVTTGLPVPAASQQFYFTRTTASLSDASGNLMMVSDGNTILDKNMERMPALVNTDLWGGGNKVSIQHIPLSNRYYVFYAIRNNGTANSTYKLKYALVDMTLNNGKGDVISFDNLVADNLSNSFTLVEADGVPKAWLLTHKHATDSFYVYPITTTGLDNVPVKSRAGTCASLENYIFRDLKTSFNGKIIAGFAYRGYTGYFAMTYSFLETFNFDSFTGIVTNKVRTKRVSSYFYSSLSVEFSPDNRLLYLNTNTNVDGLQPCGFGSGQITQFNLCYTDSSEFTKFSYTTGNVFNFCAPGASWNAMQMGADKKIHVPYVGTTVTTIGAANRVGSYADYQFSGYTLPIPNNQYISTPNFSHRLMERSVKNNIQYEGGCFPQPISFKITNDTIAAIQWNFGDPGSGSNNVSTLLNPSHVFSQPGLYTVSSGLFNSAGSLIETLTELVQVKDPGIRLLNGYPTDTSFCAGQSMTITLPNVVNGLYYWHTKLYGYEQNHGTTNSITINNTGRYYVQLRLNDCNGCIMIDSIDVTVLDKPNFSLGLDKNICAGDSAELICFAYNADVIWNTGATTPSIWVSQPGLYWAEAEYGNNGCPFRDSININVVPAISFSLPDDTTLCNGQTLLLNPGVANAVYQWQNGSTQMTQLVSLPGIYWVRITTPAGCTKTDSITVTYINAQQVYLGRDTTLCAGENLMLEVIVPNAQYMWSTAQTTSSITVNSSGTYWVRVNNGNCVVTDTINVSFNNPPVFSLGNDTTLCIGNTMLLSVNISNGAYLWQNGATSSSISISSPGLYWLEIKKGGCTVRDSLNVQYYTATPFSLGQDRRFCQGESATITAPGGFVNYNWSTGSTSTSVVLNQAGIYWLIATNADGCIERDTLTILTPYSLPIINLGPDVNLCAGDQKILTGGNNLPSYTWSTGASAASIAVTNTGVYWVVVTDPNGCKASDTLKVNNILPLPQNFLGEDTAICSYGQLELRATELFNSYTWSTGQQTNSIIVKEPGLYSLQVRDHNSCIGKDSIRVSLKDCMNGLYVPSAFTPNNDNKNDQLKAMLFGNIKSFEFNVFNRYGYLVFTTKDPAKGWDGLIKGIMQETGNFVWICRYRINNETERVERGSSILIR